MENRFACVSKNYLLEKVLCTGGSHVHFLRDCRKYAIHSRWGELRGALPQTPEQKYRLIYLLSPHSLYKGPQSLISGGFSEIWVDGIGRPCSAVAMLSPKRLNLGRGGQHESATGATGPGDPRET